MLRIYYVLLDLIRRVRPLIEEIERRDPDLARQGRRAMTSAPLNVAEGCYSRGRNRAARYQDAAGSTGELLSVLEVAVVLGYIETIEPELRAVFDHVIGTLVNAVRGRRR